MKDNFDFEISSPEAFKSALAALVVSATVEEVDVRGAWEFPAKESTQRWEVTISELAEPFDEDD